jgi:hypothetical protein
MAWVEDLGLVYGSTFLHDRKKLPTRKDRILLY